MDLQTPAYAKLAGDTSTKAQVLGATIGFVTSPASPIYLLFPQFMKDQLIKYALAMYLIPDEILIPLMSILLFTMGWAIFQFVRGQ